jgi:hypothetical protein
MYSGHLNKAIILSHKLNLVKKAFLQIHILQPFTFFLVQAILYLTSHEKSTIPHINPVCM